MLFAILSMNPAAVRAGINVWASIGPDGGPVQIIAVDPKNPDTIHAATNGGGVFAMTAGTVNTPCRLHRSEGVNHGLAVIFKGKQ
jgi:hypothetical protein